MKKMLTLIWGVLFLQTAFAQVTDSAFETINANNIEARVNANGALFYDFENGQFSASGQPSTVRVSGLWYGGIDPAGNYKGSVQMYNEEDKADFWPGLLEPPSGLFIDDFNWVWKVTAEEVNIFREDWMAAFLSGETLEENEIPESIKKWPGRGNPFFFKL